MLYLVTPILCSYQDMQSMAQQIYESLFCSFEHLAEIPTIKINWLPKSAEMTEDDLYREIETFIEFLAKHQCKTGYADTSQYLQILTPDIQDRFNERIIPQYLAIGIAKIAFLTSTEFITQLALEQIVKEEEFSKIKTRFFDNEEDALGWLTEA